MSSIKLKHSGGNSVIIAAPSSNPASDRTLTLPGDADGTILTSNSATGKLLQIVQGTQSSEHTFNSTSFVAGNLSGTITPTAASSKILIQTSFLIDTKASGRQLMIAIYRSINGGTFTNISGGSITANTATYSGGNRLIESASIIKLDTPSYSVGNAIVYKLYGQSNGSHDVTICGQDTESLILLSEIAA